MKRMITFALLVSWSACAAPPLAADGLQLTPLASSPIASGKAGLWNGSGDGLPRWQLSTGTTVPFVTMPSGTPSEGDILYYHSGAWARRAIGSTNQVLLASTDPVWAQLTLDQILPAFSVDSLVVSPSTTLEVGATEVNPSFTASYNRTAAAAALTDTASAGGGGGVVGATSLTSAPYTSFAYNTAPLPAHTYYSPAATATYSVTWTLTANETGGPTHSRATSVSWLPRVYYQNAAITTVNEANIEALTSVALKSGFSGSYSFGSGDGTTQKPTFCFPSSFGTPSSFKDHGTGFGVPFSVMSPTVAVTNATAHPVTLTYVCWQADNFITGAFTLDVL